MQDNNNNASNADDLENTVNEVSTLDTSDNKTVPEDSGLQLNYENSTSEKSPFSLNWDDDVHPELLIVYLEETPSQITQLVPLMHKISAGTADKDEKHVASRMAHTIKGSSALVGITALSEIAYRLETLLDHSVKHPLSKDLLILLPNAASCLEALFAAVELQDEEPADYYSLFLQLDNYVNNLEESNEELELSAPELPDFILNQNNADAIQEVDSKDSVSIEPVKTDEDIQDITVEIEDIVMNLISIGANAEGTEANLSDYLAALHRFDLMVDISGYPELSLLSQWCQTNLEIFAVNNSPEDQAFIDSAEVWKWIELVGKALNDPSEISHMSTLSKELMRSEWPQAIIITDLEKVLIALRHSENTVSENNLEININVVKSDEINSEGNTELDEVQITSNNEVISWDLDVHPELLAVYFSETPEQIETVAELINKIAKGESTSEDHKKAARIAHTIKGASGVVGLESLVNLTHNLEDILDHAVNSQIPEETAELLAEASDCLESLFENIQNKQAEPEEYPSVLKKLIGFVNSIKSQQDIPTETLKSEILNDLSHEPDSLNHNFAENEDNNFENIPNKNQASDTTISEAHIRVPVSVIDKLLNLAGELVTTSSQVGDKLNNALLTTKTIKVHDERVHKSLEELSLTIDRQEKEQKDMFSSLENSDFDSLEMDSYNELHSVASLLSETVIDGQELDNSLTKQLNELNEKLRSLDQLNKDLSSVILKSRLVSINTIVPRLERIVRQTCRKTGKQAELIVTGKEIDIDTDILNGLLDPLLHMLRNSIDHGIERPEQRIKNGKDETGLIALKFLRDGNNILMSLEDDGAGIDPELIYQKAIHKNLITPKQEFSKSDTLKLVLEPGFSTQENVTDISGRGVGMDVVNTSVEELKGSLIIDSDLGLGTSFNLTIPLTLITNSTLMVKAADKIVAIPTDAIEQILYQETNSVIERDNASYVKYEESEIEVKILSQLLGWSDQPVDFSKSLSLLIIKGNDATYGIYIDSIMSSREVVVKPLSPWISIDKGVIGACHLNDGGVAPVINLATVLERNKKNKKKSANTTIQPKEVVKTANILVVDDSMSNRKALSLIIEKTDYDVLTAVDGMDALQIMNENQIDLVFTDLEMPRMNGLELTQSIRAWTDKSKTPIVMITSRTTTKHRELAAKAGVNDYLTKPVVTETLLESIETWLAKKESIDA